MNYCLINDNKISPNKALKRYIISAGIILIISGVAKALSSSGDSHSLDFNDPIFGISFRLLFILVGLLEVAVAICCFSYSNHKLCLVLVIWMSFNFLFYRIGLQLSNWHQPCKCFGNLFDVLHISAKMANHTSLAIMIYLLIGGCIMFFRIYKPKTS